MKEVAPATPIYGAYGEFGTAGQMARFAYAGQLAEPGTGDYVLGNRLFSPVLRRFLDPDPVSPFDDGGLNRYAYCGGDPINRTDPSGNAWWDWAVAGLGLNSGFNGPVERRRSPTGPVAMVMPAAAAVLDVATVAVEIGTPVSTTAGDRKSPAVFGWFGLVAGLTPGGVALTAKPATSARYVGRGQRGPQDADLPRYNIEVVPANRRPPHKFRRSGQTGQLVLKTHWFVTTDPLEPGNTHWGADTPVNSRSLLSPLRKIGREPIVDGRRNVYLYSGVHGDIRGENWANQRRLLADTRLYHLDVGDYSLFQRYLPGRNLSIEDIGGITFDEMIEKISRPGIHLHGYCFGAIDNLMLDLLCADPVPVYLRH